MQFFSTPAAVAASPRSSLVMAALMGATMLASPMNIARAATADTAVATPQSPAAAGATAPAEMKGETVEQRITSLHAALKITPAEEKKWDTVAQAMRENATAMDKRVADTHATAPADMTAVEDLKQYQKFAQAHVDGLKNLISSFSGLYSMMPPDQKKIADQVFQSSRQQHTASN